MEDSETIRPSCQCLKALKEAADLMTANHWKATLANVFFSIAPSYRLPGDIMLQISIMINPWTFSIASALFLGLSACALTDPWRGAKYSHLQTIGLDKAASSWSSGMRQTHVHADKDSNALAANWTANQMILRSEALAVRGVKNVSMSNGEYQNLSAMPETLNSFFDGRPDFRDYLNFSEITVMARAKARPDNNAIFDLEVLHRFKGFNLPSAISVTNVDQEHFGKVTDERAHKVADQQVCLFFLSSVYTKYRQAFPLTPPVSDNALLLESFPRFCEQKNGKFTYTVTGENEPILFRGDILELSPPIVKDSQKPTHLARTNSIALRGEWDILTINDDKLIQPYGVINGTQDRTNVRLPCGPFLYGAAIIVDGKYVSEYGDRYIQQHIEKTQKSCANTIGLDFAKSVLDGTFFADRQTVWFKGEHMSFIAKRSERAPSRYGHHNSYKYLSVEACVLDHPNIGANKYAGYGWFGSVPNHRVKFALVGDGEKYWKDCKPDYHVEMETVDYSLPFLDAKAVEVKSDVKPYGGVMTGGHVNQQNNSVVVSVDPDWAKQNQIEIEALLKKHPYIELREDLPYDEIVLTEN